MTIQLTEQWTGTDGSAWSAARWTVSSAGGTGGLADILVNQGRLRTGTTALVSSERAVSILGTALADMEVLVLTVPPAAGDMGSAVVGVRCGNTWNGPYPANGYYVEHEPSGAIHTPAGTMRYTVYKQVSSTPTALATVARTYLPGQPFYTRLRIKGSTISYKVWDQNVNEPAAWDGQVSDSSVTATGNAVLAVQNSTAASVTYLFDSLTISDLIPALGAISGMPANAASQLANSVSATATITNDETRSAGAVPNGQLEVQFSKTNVFAAGDILADLVSPLGASGSQESTTLNLFQAVPAPPILINAGHASGTVTDPQGFVWAADSGNTGGSVFAGTVAPLSPTPNVDIEERYGMTSYAVTVPAAGNYVVALHLGPEPTFTQAGQRVFNITVQGVQVLTNFDLFATVGQFVTYIWRGKVTVDSSKTITIQFSDIVDHASISGIAVYQDTTIPQAQYPPVVMTRSPIVGVAAMCDTGVWTGTPDPTIAIQWQRVVGGVASNIVGATGVTYAPTTADIGARLQVRVTGSNASGSFIAVSSPSAVVPQPIPQGGGKANGPYDTAIAALTGVIGWWLLNETGGSIAADQSSAQLNGIYPADTGFGATDFLAGSGNELSAVKLVANPIAVGHDARFNLSTASTAQWTLLLNVSISAATGYPKLWAKGDTDAITNGWCVFYDPSSVGPGLGFKINNQQWAFTLPNALTTEAMIGVTWDGTTLTFTYNGSIVQTFTGLPSLSITDTGPLRIGDGGTTVAKALLAISNNQAQVSNVYTKLVNSTVVIGGAGLPTAPLTGFSVGGTAWSQGGRMVAGTHFTGSTLSQLFGAGLANQYYGAPGYTKQAESQWNVPGVYAVNHVLLDQIARPSIARLYLDYNAAGVQGPPGNDPAHYITAAICTCPPGVGAGNYDPSNNPGVAPVGFQFQAGVTDICFEWKISMPQEQDDSWQGGWLVDVSGWHFEIDMTESVDNDRGIMTTIHYSNTPGGSAGDTSNYGGRWSVQPQPGTTHTFTAFVHPNGSAEVYMDGQLRAATGPANTQNMWMMFAQQFGLASIPSMIPQWQDFDYWCAWQPLSTPVGTGIRGGGIY